MDALPVKTPYIHVAAEEAKKEVAAMSVDANAKIEAMVAQMSKKEVGGYKSAPDIGNTDLAKKGAWWAAWRERQKELAALKA